MDKYIHFAQHCKAAILKKYQLKMIKQQQQKTKPLDYIDCVLSSLSYLTALPQVFSPFSTPLIGIALPDYFHHQKGCPSPISKLNKQAQPFWPQLFFIYHSISLLYFVWNSSKNNLYALFQISFFKYIFTCTGLSSP